MKQKSKKWCRALPKECYPPFFTAMETGKKTRIGYVINMAEVKRKGNEQ